MQELYIGPNEAGQRLDKYLHKALPGATTSLLYKQLRKKNITLNGKKAEGKEVLQQSDKVQCFFSDETFATFSGGYIQKMNNSEISESDTAEYLSAYDKLKDIKIIYEDQNILIANKPVGILTQKAEVTDLSLNEWVIGYLLTHKKITPMQLHTFKPSVCNRLDRNTSGIVLCGISLAGSQALSKLIKDRTLQKFYVTICEGKLTSPQTISGFLTKDKKNNKVTIVQKPSSEEDKASQILTKYRPIQSSDNYTLLEVELITGKTHQIRAHLASISHPLIGDKKYGGKECFHLKSQLLHAQHIVFPASIDDMDISELQKNVLRDLCGKTFYAEAPNQFQHICEKLEFKL